MTEGRSEIQPPYYAPNCRRGEHAPVAHHHRFGQVVGRLCECPCHFATNDGTPWWDRVEAASIGRVR